MGTGADDTSSFYALEAGIEKKWHALGKTTILAQYYDSEGGANDRRTVAGGDAVNPFGATTSRIFSTGVEMFGGGVVQSIDAASMLLYAYYRHYEADLTVMSGATGAGAIRDADLEDLDVVMSGASSSDRRSGTLELGGPPFAGRLFLLRRISGCGRAKWG